MKKKILFVASEFASGMIPFAATAINALAKDDRFEVHCLCVNSGIYSYRNIILQDQYNIPLPKRSSPYQPHS